VPCGQQISAGRAGRLYNAVQRSTAVGGQVQCSALLALHKVFEAGLVKLARASRCSSSSGALQGWGPAGC
jgi:hypothetical protein